MRVRSRPAALLGSGLFLLLAPGTIAGVIPWLITDWRTDPDSLPAVPIAALVLMLLGGIILLECFVRFAWVGLGTPAPVAPTRTLVVSGFYRHVRNPMYLAVMSLIVGQALLFGSLSLLLYGLGAWLVVHIFVLLYEEPVLNRSYGEQYRRYRDGVPRWLPRLTAWRDGEDVRD